MCQAETTGAFRVILHISCRYQLTFGSLNYFLLAYLMGLTIKCVFELEYKALFDHTFLKQQELTV